MLHRRTLPLLVLVALLSLSSNLLAGAYEEILAAARTNRTDAVIDWVQRGLDPNTADASGTTLLMFAALNGNEPLMEFLLKKHANSLQQNRYGDTALALAALNGRQSIVQRMLDFGVPADGAGWTALHYAVFNGHVDIVRELIARGASMNARAPNRQTALMLATRNGNREIVRILLEAGADARMSDLAGNTALEIALKAGNHEIAGYLRASVATGGR